MDSLDGDLVSLMFLFKIWIEVYLVGVMFVRVHSCGDISFSCHLVANTQDKVELILIWVCALFRMLAMSNDILMDGGFIVQRRG